MSTRWGITGAGSGVFSVAKDQASSSQYGVGTPLGTQNNVINFSASKGSAVFKDNANIQVPALQTLIIIKV